MNDVSRIIGLFAIGSTLTFGMIALEVTNIGMKAAEKGDTETVGVAILLLVFILLVINILSIMWPK